MRILEVIPSTRYRNTVTGRSASIYGACPWSSKDEADWMVETSGFTWRCANGTIGLGRVPAATREEAVEVMNRVNAR